MKEFASKMPEIKFLSPIVPFAFNPKKMEFVVGNSGNQKTFKTSLLNVPDDVVAPSAELFHDYVSENGELLLLTQSGDLIELPALRKKLISLDEKNKKKICQEARSVIDKVFIEKNEIKIKPMKKNAEDSLGALRMPIARIDDAGGFFLCTHGNFATLQHSSEITFDPILYPSDKLKERAQTDPDFPMSYGLHNIYEGARQYLSLYAGAGTIAWLAKKV